MKSFTGKQRVGTLGLLGLIIVVALQRLGFTRSIPALLLAKYVWAAQALDKKIGWDRLPLPLGLLVLLANRTLLRQRNLHDTGSGTAPALDEFRPHVLTARTVDGSFNDLGQPAMGRAGTRFGRNVPLEHTVPDPEPAILTPNPRTVSRQLLTRDTFVPAPTLNMLAAAWIQFMLRDWLSHGKGDIQHAWNLPLDDDDPRGGDGHERPMRIPRTMADPTRVPTETDTPPTYINTETQWWDGSQIYGSSREALALVRSGDGGKLRIGPDSLIPRDLLALLTQQPGSWIGLAMLQTLFVLEHNAICDRLRAEYPAWSDDALFDHARLVIAALLAKIHAVEWTPAIVSHPTASFAVQANWWGIQRERLHKAFGRISDNDVLSGIPASATDHHTAPYAITEEFVAVYRMHPLLRDDYTFRSVATDAVLQERGFPDVTDRHTQDILDQVSMTDLLYSFGIAHPGAIQLHNFPRGLQEFRRPDGKFVDMAALDVLRSRELGVPKYNQFRRLLHLPPARSFEALTDNPVWAEEMRRVYDNDIERVDPMIGMYAEPRPEGFGFSDTAFRIFILMASRRLKSDRFFTVDYTPAVYTHAGLDWIAENTMLTVLRRHFPDLSPPLRQITNAFTPWPRVSV